MGFIRFLGLNGDNIAKPINAVSNLYTTDKARLEGEEKLEETIQKPMLAQLSNNAILAGSLNFFTSGWQPMLGWTSGFLVLLYYAPQIIIATYIWGHTCFETGIVTIFPIDPANILNIIYLLFGAGVHSLVTKK